MLKKSYILFFALLVFACNKDEQSNNMSPSELLNVPAHFPAVVFPADNPFSEASWELGKMLFFDPVLSADSTKSCASCHKIQQAFADDVAFSFGVENRIGTRNVTTLSNVAYHPYFTREGGVPSLEMQVLVPIQEHNEFDFNIILAAERLQKIEAYINLSQEAYNTFPTATTITNALATFERTLISANSKYDQFLVGKTNLNEAELAGKNLFFSDSLACSSCHSGFDFTNYEFANNGLYENYEDEGRFRLTNEETDRAKFKIPTLRNIAKTAPYMHNGTFETLEDVISHYENGVKNHENLSAEIKNFELTTQEKTELIAFLHTLTDESFLNNTLLQNQEK